MVERLPGCFPVYLQSELNQIERLKEMFGLKKRDCRFSKHSRVFIAIAVLFSIMSCKPLESLLGMSDDDGDETALLLGLAFLLSRNPGPDFENAPAYSVQTYEQAGDFVTVTPGVAYLCGIQSTDDGSGNYVEDVSTSRVILSKAILPPLESAARMLGGIIVKETPWGKGKQSATYYFMAENEEDQIPSHTSCDMETVQDASGNQYLILAYDTLVTYDPDSAFSYEKRKMEFQVIPLAADSSVKSRGLWVTNTRDIPEPDRMEFGYSTSLTQLDTHGSNIEIGVVGNSIYITAMNDGYLYQDPLYQAPVTIYYPTVEDAMAETNYKMVLHEPGPEATRPNFYLSLSNTWDTTVVGDEFVVAALTWEIKHWAGSSLPGIRYWWLKDGVVDRTQEIVAATDADGPRATTHGIYNYRIDADYWDNRTGTGSGMFQAIYSDLSTQPSTPGTNDWAKEIRFALADDAGETRFQMRTGLEFSFSDLLLETEDTTVPDQHINITEGGPELLDTVRSVSSWDAMIHNGKIYILFRDPTEEPAEPRFALYSPAVFTADATDGTGLDAEQPQHIWPTPEYESRWSTLKGGSFPESYRGTSEATYALPDMADYRTRTRCQIFNQEFQIHSDLAYTFDERGQAPYPFFLLDPYACNNLLKTRVYKQSDSSPEQLLIMHPDSEYKMRLDLVDLP